jgi:hypothetical protein
MIDQQRYIYKKKYLPERKERKKDVTTSRTLSKRSIKSAEHALLTQESLPEKEAFHWESRVLLGDNIFCGRPLGTVNDIETYPLTFLQTSEPIGSNCRVMNKHI